MNELDIIDQFRSAMADSGIVTSANITPSGKLERFTIDGDKPKSLNGWYVLFADGIPSGSYGSWKTGQTYTWCSKKSEEISPAERDEMNRRIAVAAEFRKAEERNTKPDLEKADDEAGDVIFYLQEYCNFRGIGITDLMELNRLKLEKRYPVGFDFTGGKR